MVWRLLHNRAVMAEGGRNRWCWSRGTRSFPLFAFLLPEAIFLAAKSRKTHLWLFIQVAFPQESLLFQLTPSCSYGIDVIIPHLPWTA